MPVARNFPQISQEGNDGAVSAGGEPDGDAEDNRTYCFCDGVSYGEMIGCDDEDCEREWVSVDRASSPSPLSSPAWTWT